MIVRFTPSAQADIQSIFDYIAQDNAAAAAGVVAAIETATNRLALFPMSGRAGAVEITRELVIPRQPYIAVYIITDVEVKIIAVFHAAQDIPRSGI
jgi:toxin ParE1/3/4